eukprot:scaffold7583_cov578-Prasinococcus_capsulatus_cf.AAC.2
MGAACSAIQYLGSAPPVPCDSFVTALTPLLLQVESAPYTKGIDKRRGLDHGAILESPSVSGLRAALRSECPATAPPSSVPSAPSNHQAAYRQTGTSGPPAPELLSRKPSPRGSLVVIMMPACALSATGASRPRPRPCGRAPPSAYF